MAIVQWIADRRLKRNLRIRIIWISMLLWTIQSVRRWDDGMVMVVVMMMPTLETGCNAESAHSTNILLSLVHLHRNRLAFLPVKKWMFPIMFLFPELMMTCSFNVNYFILAQNEWWNLIQEKEYSQQHQRCLSHNSQLISSRKTKLCIVIINTTHLASPSPRLFSCL